MMDDTKMHDWENIKIILLHKTAIWEKLVETLHVPGAITSGVHMVFIFF